MLEVLHDGPVKTTDVIAQAKEAGISEATLRRAKDRLGVVAGRASEGNGGKGSWSWRLPSDPQDVHAPGSVGEHLAKDVHQPGFPKLDGGAEEDSTHDAIARDPQGAQASVPTEDGHLAREKPTFGEV